MKHGIITLALAGILVSMPAFAGNASAAAMAEAPATDVTAIMTKIEKANAVMKTIECKFHQIRTIKASGKKKCR